MLSSTLRRSQIKRELKLDQTRAKDNKAKKRECRYNPDLSETNRYNMKISKSMVDFRREISIKKYLDKCDNDKQEVLLQKTMVEEGCTFTPRINIQNNGVHRNISSLFLSPCSKQSKHHHLFYL
jgi:hypothetical protein